MADYSIYFRASIEKDFKSIPTKDVKKILQRIQSLTKELRPTGCEKLTDQEQYRVRQGSYRIIFSIQDEEHSVVIVKVIHRKDVYRK
jgi:mRNA interferase RelE/StbE